MNDLNIPLINKIISAVRANYSRVNMAKGICRTKEECGTTGCIAGLAVLIGGNDADQERVNGYIRNAEMREFQPNQEFEWGWVRRRAVELLGLPSDSKLTRNYDANSKIFYAAEWPSSLRDLINDATPGSRVYGEAVVARLCHLRDQGV